MAEYLVSARKYRPALFDEVIGQEHITQTLENAITRNRIAHAYLFTGPRGVGKTTTARIFSKALNCDQGLSTTPCNQCQSCRQITDGLSLDVLEIDGASNRGIDEIRSLKENINYAPGTGKFKVYIIDEVHMLTEQAFNALLKTLEEPPPRVIFIFATTEPHRIPITILSRCQRYDFRRIPQAQITEQLRRIAQQEEISIPTDAINLITRKAEGSMRDAESLFDQVSSFCGREITTPQVEKLLGITGNELFVHLMEALTQKDYYTGLHLINQMIYSGQDIFEFLNGLTEFIRNLIILKLQNQPDRIFGISPDEIPRLLTLAGPFAVLDLYRMINLVSRYESIIKFSGHPTIQLEMLIFKLFSLNSLDSIETIITQIKNTLPPEPRIIPPAGIPSPAGVQPAENIPHSGPTSPLSPAAETLPNSPDSSVSPPDSQPTIAAPIPSADPPTVSDRSPLPNAPAAAIPSAVSSDPAPATEPSSVRETQPDSLPSENLLGIWQHLISRIASDQRVLADYLAEAVPISLENDRLELKIPEATERLKTMLEKPETCRRIQAEWLTLRNQKIKIDYQFIMLDKSKFEQEFRKEIPVIEIKTRNLDDYKNEYPMIGYLVDQFKAEISDKNKPKPGRRKKDE